jgi:hypothetical protein
MKDRLGDQRADKNSFRRMNSTYAQNPQPRILTWACQGRVVTTDLPTLGTSLKQTSSKSATQEANDLTKSGRSLADGPLPLGGQSINCNQASNTAPSKFGPFGQAPRTTWGARTVRPHLADSAAQNNACSQTDEHATVGVLDRQPTKGSTRSRLMWPRRDR